MGHTSEEKLRKLADAWHNVDRRETAWGAVASGTLALPVSYDRAEPAHREDGLSAADLFSAAGLNYRAYRRGDPLGAYNAAMFCFNREDFGATGIGSVVQPARAILMPSNSYAVLRGGFRTALLARLVGVGR